MRYPPLRGFMLIELLVVIAIISLLASVVLAALHEARVKARDVKRNTTAVQYRTALGLYQIEHNGYPHPGPPHNLGLGQVWCIGEGHTAQTCDFARYYVSTVVNDALRPYFAAMPIIEPASYFLGGPHYYCSVTFSPNICKEAVLRWMLEDENPPCPLGGTLVDLGTARLCVVLLR